jgi:hypothetical protein
MSAMTIDEFIELLREKNTGAPADIVVADKNGQLWDPRVLPDRIRVAGDPPYAENDGSPFVFVIRPDDGSIL